MFFYVVLVLITLIYFVYNYFTQRLNYWKAKGVVGPKPIFFYGNYKETALRRKNIAIIFKEAYENYPNEKVVGMFRMSSPCLLIRDPDIIKQILIKDFDLFVDRGLEFSKKGLGANLFHADGDTWRVLRNRFTPIFTSGKLKHMLYLMTERGEKFVEYIESLYETQSELEVRGLVQKFTVSTISACAFGLDVDLIQDKLETLKKVDRLILTPNFAHELELIFPGILKSLNMSILPSFVNEVFESLAKNVISQRNGVPSNRKDFMDLILELRQQGEVQSTKRNTDDKQYILELSDEVITAQAFIFYVAGYETSATTLAFMLYEMANHPDIQDKLLKEIDQVLEKHNNEVTYEALNDMVYLENIFSEVLRMYPIVDPLLRRAQVDYKVPGTNVTISKGTTIAVSAMGLHYDEKYFKNPTKFDPDRFNPENQHDRHPCVYTPFGLGPRNCIGMRFAKFQTRVCIMKLLSKFRVETSNNTPKVMNIDPNRVIVGPDGGIHLNFIKRV